MWNFSGSWFLTLKFPILKLRHAILQNFQGWKLVFSRISKGKVTNLKFPEGWGASKKYTYPPPPPVWSFSGIAQCQWTCEFHPKSQKKLLQKKFQTGGRVEDLKYLGSLGYIEKLCSRVQLKKELVLPGVMKKVVVFSPSSSLGCSTIFPGLRDEASFCLEFLGSDKSKNSQFFFSKK